MTFAHPSVQNSVFITISQQIDTTVSGVWRAAIIADFAISTSSKSDSAVWNLIDSVENLGFFITNVSTYSRNSSLLTFLKI
jgi:hypothetical protein